MATLELWRQNLTKKKGRTCACVNVIIHSRVDKEPSKVFFFQFIQGQNTDSRHPFDFLLPMEQIGLIVRHKGKEKQLSHRTLIANDRNSCIGYS